MPDSDVTMPLALKGYFSRFWYLLYHIATRNKVVLIFNFKVIILILIEFIDDKFE